jgi:hypothetical protein
MELIDLPFHGSGMGVEKMIAPTCRPGHSLNRALALRSFSLFFIVRGKKFTTFPSPFYM